MKRWLFGAVAALSLSCAACTGPRYVAQAGCGQLELVLGRRDLVAVVADPRTDPALAAVLAEVPAIKRFGRVHGLTPTTSYEQYVDVGADAVVWVVSAAEPLSFSTKTWVFPIVGSVPYLGWFDERDAREQAAELEDEGWDVDLRGAGAYSTLGWFDDPVLSTMLPEGADALGELVDVVLHESVHATVYVSGQSSFDESLASYVAEKLTRRYLAERGPAGAAELAAYDDGLREANRRRKLLHDGHEELSRLYASRLPAAEKLERKARIVRELERSVLASRPINNATLAQYKTYHADDGAFDELFQACGADVGRMMKAIRRLSSADFQRPQQTDMRPVLRTLVRRGC